MRFGVVVSLLGAAACGSSSATPETSATTTEVREKEIVIPADVLAAMPFQNRLDVPKGIFQMKLYNGTDELLPVIGVQLVWEGLTTPMSERANNLAAGDRLDYPVALAPADCLGDGTIDDMPDPNSGYVRVLLADGRELRAQVFDVLHFARKLYLDDCERQFIASQVAIEWVDLRSQMLDGRTVTDGTLRLTRLAGKGEIKVLLMINTIVFTFEAPGATGAIAVLPEESNTVDVPIRFLEGRCDSHALSEASQPFAFVAVLQLGDGVERSVALPIPSEDQVAMRTRMEAGCEYLGKTGVLGQDA